MFLRGMKMKKHVVKARLIIALTALVAFLSLFLTVSCAKWNKKNSEAESEVETEKIFLITDDTPNCSMTISDETFKYLNKNDDYSYILDLMDDYFNVVINDEIEPYVVYIKAVSEKIDIILTIRKRTWMKARSVRRRTIPYCLPSGTA